MHSQSKRILFHSNRLVLSNYPLRYYVYKIHIRRFNVHQDRLKESDSRGLHVEGIVNAQWESEYMNVITDELLDSVLYETEDANRMLT